MLELYSFSFLAMGTECHLHFYAQSCLDAEEIAQSAIAEVLRIERRYSRYSPESMLSMINSVARRGGSIAVDEETAGLLTYAYACYKKSGGLFDISSGILRRAWDFTSDELPSQETIDALLSKIGLEKLFWDAPNLEFSVSGMELDLGGIGKEYAADRVAVLCSSQGIEHGIVDLGGDITVIGTHPAHSAWQIGIRHPREPESLMESINLSHGALASSGDYERCIELGGKRYGHIIDPRTGWPVQGLASVSVIADQCMVAGSICTIAMLKGSDGVQWLSTLGVRHLWMDEEGNQGGNLYAESGSESTM